MLHIPYIGIDNQLQYTDCICEINVLELGQEVLFLCWLSLWLLYGLPRRVRPGMYIRRSALVPRSSLKIEIHSIQVHKEAHL